MFDVAFIEQCKNPYAPTQIVQQIINNESGKNEYAINVNSNGKSLKAYIPKTKEKAAKIAKEWIAKGYTVDIGLMQINSDNLAKYNTTVDEVLDPCKNINVASSIYHNAYKKTPKTDSPLLRTKKALSVYNTGTLTKGFRNGYVARYFPGTKSKYTQNKPISKKVKKYARYLLSIKFPSSQIATIK